MNASVKFRDGRRPLFKLKMPVNMFGLPLQSGVTLGDGDDLGFHIGTSFAYGPTWRVKFHPSEGNPPALEVKTGLGRWGSNKNAALQLSAEWDLADLRGNGARFMLRVKPRLGDFSLRHSSVAGCGEGPHEEANRREERLEAGPRDDRHEASPDSPASRAGSENGNASDDSLVVVDGADPASAPSAAAVRNASTAKQGVQRAVGGMRRGSWYLNVHSRLPLGKKANARVRWAVRVPDEMFSAPARGFGALNLEHRPMLTLEKLSIETNERRSLSFEKSLYEQRPPPRKPRRETRKAPEPSAELQDVKEELSRVKSQTQSNTRSIQKLESENFDLRSAVDDLKAQFAKPRARESSSPASVILREEAMLRSQLKHLAEEEERGRRERGRNERPRQLERRAPPPELERDADEEDGAQDEEDITAKLRQALMQRGSRR